MWYLSVSYRVVLYVSRGNIAIRCFIFTSFRCIIEWGDFVWGDRIKTLREKRNLTQSALGDLLDVQQQTIAGWEKEKRSPDIDAFIKLANFFHVSLDYLVGRTDEPFYVSVDQCEAETEILFSTTKKLPEQKPGEAVATASASISSAAVQSMSRQELESFVEGLVRKAIEGQQKSGN
jgi:transcriptional regulator with XRE-family HTH domain